MTEDDIQYLLGKEYGLRYPVIPNVNFGWVSCRVPIARGKYLYPFRGVTHEADIICITASDKLLEIEIKCTYSDFLNDFKKKDWKHLTDYTLAVYYCFPSDVYEKNKAKINKKIAEKIPYAGVITAFSGIRVVKPAKNLICKKLPIEAKVGLLRIGCQKWWKRVWERKDC